MKARRSLILTMALTGLILVAIGLVFESQRPLFYPGAFALIGALFVEVPSRRRKPPA
jgi:hypothetical protein